MANPIRRIVQLIYDRNAARTSEQAAKRSTSIMGRAFGSLKTQAIALGGAIAAAFAVRKIINFGKEAVRVAVEANGIWTRLAGTLATVGVDFNMVEGDIRNMARAMQDATAVGDEDFAATLQTLVAISKDYERSLTAVGVAADLAAAMNIDLKTAAQLVGRAMVGETALFKRYGIIIDATGDVLQQLRDQFGGMAENEVAGLEGQVKQLNNEWSDFKQAVGNALIEASNGTSILQTLTATVKTMTEWVDRNRDAFVVIGTVLGGLVKTLGLVFDGWWRLSNLVTSGWTGLVGLVVDGTADMVEGFAELVDGLAAVKRFFGFAEGAMEETADKLHERAMNLRRTATDLFNTMDALRQEATEARDRPPPERRGRTTDFRAGIDVREPPPTTDPEADAAAQKELERLMQEAARITEAVRTPAEIYAATLATLKMHLDAGRISQETYNRAVAEAKEAYDKANESVNAIDAALLQHEQTLRTANIMSQALGEEYDALETEAQSIISTLQTLAEAGLDPLDERFAGLVQRLAEVRAGMRRTQEETETTAQIAGVAGQLVGAAFGAGIGQLASAKAQQNAILAAEQIAHAIAALTNPFTAGKAGAHFAAAAKYAAVAAAWKGLASAAGGGGGIGAGGGLGTSGGGFGRDAGGFRSEGANPTGPEVHIYLEGTGFTAVNPEVQRVVYGAQQLATERYGDDARIKIHRTQSG